jgi:hypothetical protein
MKKLFLTTVLLLVSLFSSAQQMSKEYLKGQWTSNGEATELWINIDSAGEMLITDISSYTGDPLKVTGVELYKNEFYIKSVFEQNDFTAVTKFIVIDQDTMLADIASAVPGTVTYKRVLKPNNN